MTTFVDLRPHRTSTNKRLTHVEIRGSGEVFIRYTDGAGTSQTRKLELNGLKPGDVWDAPESADPVVAAANTGEDFVLELTEYHGLHDSLYEGDSARQHRWAPAEPQDPQIFPQYVLWPQGDSQAALTGATDLELGSSSDEAERRRVHILGHIRRWENQPGFGIWTHDDKTDVGLAYARHLEMMVRAVSQDANMTDDDIFSVIENEATLTPRDWFREVQSAAWVDDDTGRLSTDRTSWAWASTTGHGYNNDGSLGSGGAMGGLTTTPKNAAGTIKLPSLNTVADFDWIGLLA